LRHAAFLSKKLFLRCNNANLRLQKNNALSPMNLPLLNLLRTSKVFAVVLGLHLFILSLLLFHPGCQHTPATGTPAPMGEVTALDNATLSEPTRPVDAVGTSSVNAVAADAATTSTSAATASSVTASAPIEAPAATTYTVVKGDSPWSIAHKNGVSLSALLEANALSKTSTLKIGQELKIPAAATSSSAATAAPSATSSTESAPEATVSASSYKVKAGDSLARIAKRHGVSVRALKAANHLSSDTIRVGQKLQIPAKAEAISASASSATAPEVTPATATTSATEATVSEEASETSYATHTVAKGESPAVIAKQYGMKTSELLALNHITDPRKLKVGQELKVKGSRVAETSATTSSSSGTPSVEALDAMTSDKAAEAAPALEVHPAATLQ
jgi:LysM repeat protein